MTQEFQKYFLNTFIFALVLFGMHSYLLAQFFDGELIIPVWSVYVFNLALIWAVFYLIKKQAEKENKKVAYIFFALTIVKMILALVFLSPLFFGKSDHTQLEIINFFVPYFLFLTAEIIGLNKFLLKL